MPRLKRGDERVPYKKVSYDRAIELMANGLTMNEAARKLKVNHNTINAWAKLEDFSNKLIEAKKAADTEWVSALRGLIPESINALKKALSGKFANGASMTKAVDFIWNNSGMLEKKERKDENITIEFSSIPIPEVKIEPSAPDRIMEEEIKEDVLVKEKEQEEIKEDVLAEEKEQEEKKKLEEIKKIESV